MSGWYWALAAFFLIATAITITRPKKVISVLDDWQRLLVVTLYAGIVALGIYAALHL